MYKELKTRMESLVVIDAKSRFDDAIAEIIFDFRNEGFEDSEIFEYLKKLIKKQIKN